MGIIYKPNILKHSFTDSLYDAPTFQKVWHFLHFHFLQEFLHFNGKANSSYDPSDGRRGCCHHVCLFTYIKLCCKLYYPKNQLSVGKSLVLFKCQFHFKQYIKRKRVCFRIKLYKLTSSNGKTLFFFS